MQSSKLSQLIGELYRHAHQADGWMAFFAMLETEIPSRSTTLMFEDIQTHDTDIVLSRHLNNDELQVYGEHYIHTDLWAGAMADLPLFQFHSSEVVLDRQLLSSEFYADYTKPLDIRYACGAYIENPKIGQAFRVTIQRGHQHNPFSREELQTLNLFVPHLQNALAIYKRNIALESLQRGFDSISNIIDSAAYLLRPDMSIVSQNALAEELLQQDIACIAAGKLSFRSHKLRNTIAQLMNSLQEFTHNRATSCRNYARMEQYQISIEPHLLPSLVPGAQELGALLQIKNSDTNVNIDLAGLEILYGLTNTEAGVTRLLCKGLVVKEISEAMGVKESTIRSHLKAVYAKLDVCSQPELLSKIMASLARTQADVV
ncbi:helix-turn-helix transcriptional regulator [Spongiibacter sp. KMU-166]|uniref:Helix-turn-helix transcriptional regulator n=1 Tax=Spongiibacter thalassae TaxID=2721624 RepID=A0ABX1GFX1_9GAMM|nr:helix-turn-helix transcriptional regulator [Spongiibacter thalassae]NKI18094.1 helix-turn-helix transcriptional regulator [Spongiibacter thalassae]